MRVIARACHSQFPHTSLQDVALEMASQRPPMFPEATPVFMFAKRCPVYPRIFKKTGQPKEHAFSLDPVFAERLKFCAFRKQQESEFIQFVAESTRKPLKQCFVYAVYHRRAFEMLRLLLHPDLGRRFDERINRRAWEFTQRGTASSWMNCRRMPINQVDFLLQVNLDNFAVLPCPGKVARSAAVKEDMKHDPVKGSILRMSVAFPIRNMHVPFH